MAPTDGHERSPRKTLNKAKVLKDKQTRGWTEKQQKETDDTGLHMQYKEDKKQCLSGFILPSLNTPGFAHASRVAHVTSPATKAKVKADKGEEERQQLDKVPPEKKRATGSSRRDKDHRKGHGQHFPAKLTRDTCESEDEPDTKSGSDSNRSNDDDFPPLPGVRICCTDSSGADSLSGTNEVEENETVQASNGPSSDTEQDPHKFFPPKSTNQAGRLLRPTEPSALGSNRWVVPLPLKNALSSSSVNPGVRAQVYDLLADFPALQPPANPSLFPESSHGNPKTNAAEEKRGLPHWPKYCQHSRAPHVRRVEKIPCEVSSICSGYQKSKQNLLVCGQANRQTLSRAGHSAAQKFADKGTSSLNI